MDPEFTPSQTEFSYRTNFVPSFPRGYMSPSMNPHQAETKISEVNFKAHTYNKDKNVSSTKYVPKKKRK